MKRVLKLKEWIKDEIDYRRDQIRSILYNIKYFIKNCIDYRRILIEDRDWDYTYLLILMKFKINKIAKGLRNESYHVGALVRAKEAESIARMLEKLIEEDWYKSKKLEKLMEKYPPWGSNKKEMPKKDSEWMSKYFDKKDKEKIALKRKVFNLLHDKIESWWF